MEFPEKIKMEARKASAFKCCLCHEKPSFHVHHINRELTIEEGLHDIDNAAPLCVECHETYGNDPTRRNFIKQARDFWFEIVKKKYHGMDWDDEKNLIDSRIKYLEKLFLQAKAEKQKEDYVALTQTMMALSNTSGEVSGSIVNSPLKIEFPENSGYKCLDCGTMTSFIFNSTCPRCGSKKIYKFDFKDKE